MQLPRLRTRRAQERGAVIPMVALALTVLMTMTAFAIDLGRMRTERRDLQADADALALDAVQMIEGLDAVAALPVAIAEANASAVRNGMHVTLTSNEVQVGIWDVATHAFTPQWTALEYPHAVRVTLTGSVPMYFDFSTDERSVTRTGVAVARAQAKAELGSVTAGVGLYDPADLSECEIPLDAQLTFMNELYTEYLGINVSGGVEVDSSPIDCGVTGAADGLSLDLASWRGLAAGQVDLADVAARMGFANADDLLTSTVDAGELLQATADSMQASGNATDVFAGTILGSFTTHIAQDLMVSVGDIVGANVGDPSTGAADATVNALDLLGATAMAIDGNHFTTVEIPVNLPFASTMVTPRITVVEPPQVDEWKFAGQDGPHTSQVRFAMTIPLTGVRLDFGLLGGLLAPLGLKTSNGEINIVVEAGRADGHYDDVACLREGPDASRVTFSVNTGAATVTFGTITDADLQEPDQIDFVGEIGERPLLNGVFDLVTTLGVDLDLNVVTNVKSMANFLGATEAHTFAGPYETPWYRYDGGVTGTSLTDSAFANVDYKASNGLLTTLLTTDAAMTNLLNSALQPVIDELGPEVIDPLLSALGATVGGADARIKGVRCQVPALANRAVANEG